MKGGGSVPVNPILVFGKGPTQRQQGQQGRLFKGGMAAPYAGLPAPHMFREVVWHCIARPLRMLTYWSLPVASNPCANGQTQDELDKLFGLRPAWKSVVRAMRLDKKKEIFLTIPELNDEVSRLHHEVVHPLGALLPKWQNLPRRSPHRNVLLIPSFFRGLRNHSVISIKIVS